MVNTKSQCCVALRSKISGHYIDTSKKKPHSLTCPLRRLSATVTHSQQYLNVHTMPPPSPGAQVAVTAPPPLHKADQKTSEGRAVLRVQYVTFLQLCALRQMLQLGDRGWVATSATGQCTQVS